MGMQLKMPASIDTALGAHDLAHDQRGLLDLIDTLQFAQLDNVKLPQIVVVGDQSAGKSSVLEAITGTPFPRDAGACTRFATEIRMRRAAESRLTVSIIPDRTKPVREQERLRSFGGTVDGSMSFDALMRSAVELIAPAGVPGRFAARDILVVEKLGPDMPLLTLVDLPGLVRNANNDQSLEDIRMIDELSNRYMKSKRTIILAVVGGNSDYVQAPILTKARQFDPTGARTIGVLTKPDLTKDIGLEDKFIELVQNRDKENLFGLGWYVLLNPGPREPGQAWPSQEERSRREAEFFTRGKWNTLPPHMVGVNALKQKLSVQLQRHIGRYVKVLRRQIQAALDRCKDELKSLGEGKDTIEEMKVELGRLFSESKELVMPAVYGTYNNPSKKKFFSNTADPNGVPWRNLRARAIEENERFADHIRMNGRKHNFSHSGDRRFSSLTGGSGDSKDEFARVEVEPLLKQFRGTELPGDAKPNIVYKLFQNHSENWDELSQTHKDNLVVVCNNFLSEVIDFIWPERMRDALRMHFLEPYMERLMGAAEEELERLSHDLHLEVQPYDPDYVELLRAWQTESTKEGASYTEAREVLEKMLIYYELSAKTYIRNVITQVVERHLLQGLYAVFNSTEAMALDNDTVEAIAAENKETRDRRVSLRNQKAAIEKARDICASLAMRKELHVHPADEIDMDDDSSEDETGRSRLNRVSSAARPATAASTSTRASAQPSLLNVASPARDRRPSPRTSYEAGPVPGPSAEPLAYRAPSRTEAPTQQTWADDYYTTSAPRAAAPPQAAPPPPPPPRPTKVRDEHDYAASSPVGAGLPPPPRGGQPSSARPVSPVEQHQSYYSANAAAATADHRSQLDAAADYVASQSRRSGVNKLLGRRG